MNPVVTHYITNSKSKLRMNAANTVAYNVGEFIVAVLFTIFAKQMVVNWRLTLTFFASLTILFFVRWLWKAENFETKENSGGTGEAYGYKDALKDGFLWRYGMAFASFLTLYVLSLVRFKAVFEQYTLLNGSVTNLFMNNHYENDSKTFNQIQSMKRYISNLNANQQYALVACEIS